MHRSLNVYDKTLLSMFLFAGFLMSENATGLFTPAICAVDPTCRKLTQDEINLVKPVFGDKLNYAAVHVFERREYNTFIQELFRGKRDAGTASRNAIYLHQVNDIDQSEHARTGFKGYPNQTLLTHELTHVAQNQNKIPNTGSELIYAVTLEEGKPLTGYKSEQQATIVEAYAAAYRKLEQLSIHFKQSNTPPEIVRPQLMAPCQEAETIATVIRPHLPASPHPACLSLKFSS